MNRDFFDNSCKPLTMIVESSEPLNLYFGGPEGYGGYYYFNNVEITPTTTDSVEIIFVSNDNSIENISMIINKSTIIRQEVLDPYTKDHKLFFGDSIYEKKESFRGSLLINGPCQVTQTMYMFVCR